MRHSIPSSLALAWFALTLSIGEARADDPTTPPAPAPSSSPPPTTDAKPTDTGTPPPAAPTPSASVPPAAPAPSASVPPAVAAPKVVAPVDTQNDVAKAPPQDGALPQNSAPTEGAAPDPAAVGGPIEPADPYAGFHMGPVLSLGLPRLLGAGLVARLGKYVSLGVNYQVLPKMKLPIYSATASSFLIDVFGRVHPFGGAFYVSFGGGYQETHGSASAGAVGAEGEISSPVLTTSLGWFWMWNDGFGIGFEPLGLSIPVGAGKSSAKLTGDQTLIEAASEYTDMKQQVDDTVDQIGKYPVPQFNLVRIGVLF